MLYKRVSVGAGPTGGTKERKGNAMGYLHIANLYANKNILQFKECYALEKIHGSSANLSYDSEKPEGEQLTFFSGGAKHEEFVKLFNQEELLTKIRAIGYTRFVLYGEAYGGKMQKMSGTYGPSLKFIAFDVWVAERWLEVPRAEQYAINLGLEFVFYKRVPATVEALDAERDAFSVQAIRNGCGDDKLREGIVCRPLMEFSYGKDENSRVICKHKREEFRETKSVRTVESEEKRRVMEEVTLIVDEWCVPERLRHVLDKLGETDSISINRTKEVITAMTEDILREAAGEVVESKPLLKEIGNRTARMFKEFLNASINA
jgi:hypothetical protein